MNIQQIPHVRSFCEKNKYMKRNFLLSGILKSADNDELFNSDHRSDHFHENRANTHLTLHCSYIKGYVNVFLYTCVPVSWHCFSIYTFGFVDNTEKNELMVLGKYD